MTPEDMRQNLTESMMLALADNRRDPGPVYETIRHAAIGVAMMFDMVDMDDWYEFAACVINNEPFAGGRGSLAR